MIEDTIQKLTASIDALTAALNASRTSTSTICTSGDTKTVAVEAPKAEAPKAATLDELREWGQKVLDAGKTGVLVGIAKELGVKRVSEVAPDKYAEVIERLKTEVANG